MFACWFVRNTCYVLLTLNTLEASFPKRFNLYQHCSGPIPTDFIMSIARSWFRIAYYILAPLKVGRGTIDSPWRLSVNVSVCKNVSTTFGKKSCSIHFYLAITLMGRVSGFLFIFTLLPSILVLCWPNSWQVMGFRDFVEKLLSQFISCLTLSW